MQQTRSAGMNRATPYLYVIPCILLLGIFVYIPLVANFFYSTQTFSAFSPTKTFVGLTNYKEMLADPVIRTAIVNNIWYCVISVIFQVGLSLCIAAVLEDKLLRHVSTMLRTMYFLPVLISMTVVALLFSFVYHPKIGLINAGLKMIGLGNLAHAWTGATDTAIFSAIAMSQWHSMGYTMMLFIVAHSGHSGGSLRGGRDRRRGAFASFHQRHAAAGEGNDLRHVRDDGYRRVPGLQRRVYPHRRPDRATPPPRWPYTCTRTALRSIRWAMLPRLRSVCSSSP